MFFFSSYLCLCGYSYLHPTATTSLLICGFLSFCRAGHGNVAELAFVTLLSSIKCRPRFLFSWARLGFGSAGTEHKRVPVVPGPIGVGRNLFM